MARTTDEVMQRLISILDDWKNYDLGEFQKDVRKQLNRALRMEIRLKGKKSSLKICSDTTLLAPLWELALHAKLLLPCLICVLRGATASHGHYRCKMRHLFLQTAARIFVKWRQFLQPMHLFEPKWHIFSQTVASVFAKWDPFLQLWQLFLLSGISFCNHGTQICKHGTQK